jgi:soluble lytic murein transglycosylase
LNKTLTLLIASFLLLLNPLPSFSGDQGLLGTAVRMIEEGRHGESLKLLKKTERSIPYVRDYILYHTARAELAQGNQRAARKTISNILRKYPGTPMRQQVKRLELDLYLSGDWDKAFPVIESYTSEYGDDNETLLLYSELLERRGQREHSQQILKDIYISTDDFSERAFELLEDRELTELESLKRAKNFYKKHWYSKAEPLLYELLLSDSCPDENIVHRMYAKSLFRQKKYALAAHHLVLLNDLYDAARAYIRSGDRESFHRTVLTMVANNDKNAPRLLVALAEEARRKGESEKAFEYLDNSIKLFPNEKEKALWSKGWLFYRLGQMEESKRIFRSLYRKYKDDKYAYWTARAMERSGEKSSSYLRKVNNNGYYALLVSVKTGKPLKKRDKFSRKRIYRKLRRADILLSEGLYTEASIELKAVSRKTRNYKELLEIARKMIIAGDFDSAQRLMNRVPERKRPDDILFPLAYWPSVKEAANKHSIDPYLMLSLMREESLFDKEAFSPAGAMGLMQLMPSTAKRMSRPAGVVLKDSKELFSPETNITIGTFYFSKLINDFGSVTPSIAAYNAGENTVRKWLDKGGYSSYDEFVEDIPYRETRNYVKRIMRSYYRYHFNRGFDPQSLQGSGLL